jgi:bis(5'-nucleosidyl)-tetraphosphatase
MKPKLAFEKSVGAVIFSKNNSQIEYLALDYGNNYWGYAKGHVEEGENEIETLKREVKEETSLEDLEIIPGFKTKNKYFYRAGKEEKARREKEGLPINIFKTVIYYLAETKTRNIKISFEHKGYLWLAFEEAIKKISYKDSKKVLKEANDFLISNKQEILI